MKFPVQRMIDVDPEPTPLVLEHVESDNSSSGDEGFEVIQTLFYFFFHHAFILD